MTDFNLISCPSPNFTERELPISMLVMHYTGMKSGKAALNRLCSPDAGVSSHYLVEEDGRIYQLVEEDKRAHHAGVSFWRGIEDCNSASIGIEIVNPGHEFGYRDFPDVQMEAVKNLSLDILKRHTIRPWNVVAHSDIAPTRKQDPGELFDWPMLARAGIGVWPAGADVMEKPDFREALPLLAEIGYKTGTNEENLTSLKAFQRHYRPNHVDGQLDNITFARIKALAEMIRNAG